MVKAFQRPLHQLARSIRFTALRPAPRAAMLIPVIAAALSAAPLQVEAQTFPSRPVRVLVPNAAGSPSDIIYRLVGVRLAEAWGRPLLVENRAGATGMIAADIVSKAPADGHTLFAVSMTNLISTLMYQRHQLATEFAPVSMVGTTPFAITVSAGLPVKNLAELIAYAKARPGQLMYGSSGQWGSLHLCMEVFNEMAGLSMTHVPHPGTPQATNALMADQIQVMCPAAPSIQTLASSGKLKPLGVTYQKPTRLLPGVPPVSETMPAFELLGWYGLQTTLKTPPEVIGRLNAELVKALKAPEIVDKLIATGVEVVGSNPAEFQGFLNRESERWTRVLRERNAKPEPL